MQQLIRILILYIATTTTILLLIVLFTIKDSTEKDKKVQANINILKQELSKITSYQQSEKEITQKLASISGTFTDNASKHVLGSTSSASESSNAAGGFVTINDKKWQAVEVYEENSYSTKLIGKIEFGKAYRYIKKEGSWYQIALLKPEINGWVAARFLREIDGNEP